LENFDEEEEEEEEDDDDDDDDVYISRTWESFRENIKASTTESLGYDLKQHKLWFDDECSKLLGHRKESKLH
jgi:hypothetical protein